MGDVLPEQRRPQAELGAVHSLSEADAGSAERWMFFGLELETRADGLRCQHEPQSGWQTLASVRTNSEPILADAMAMRQNARKDQPIEHRER